MQSNLPLTDSALGGGLFDVDGNLLGVVLRCGDHIAAVVPADVDRELARAASFEGQLLQSYGLQVTGLDDVSRQIFSSLKKACWSRLSRMGNWRTWPA